MSQVLAAKAASGLNRSATKASADARKGECFASVFERAWKTSPSDPQTSGRTRDVDGSRSAQSSTREDKPRVKDKEDPASRRARETKDGHAGRTERLQEAAEKARSDRAERPEMSSTAGQAGQEAESQPVPADETAAQGHTRPVGQANQESSDNDLQQQYNGQAAVVPASAPAGIDTVGADGPGGGNAEVAGGPPGSSVYLPGGAVPVSAAATGGSSESGQVAVPWANAPAPQAAPAALEATAEESSEASAGGKAVPSAGADGREKSAASGADFQTALTQAGRGRQAAEFSSKLATSVEAAPRAGSADQAVAINDADGPETMAGVLRLSVGARRSNMMIQLDPPELGRLRVDVRMHNDVLTVRLEAQTQAGHDALQSRLHELTAALEQQGVRLDRVEVEYRPPAEGQRDGQSPTQHGGQDYREPQFTGGGQPGGRREPSALGGLPAAEGLSTIASPQARVEPAAASGVDVVV